MMILLLLLLYTNPKLLQKKIKKEQKRSLVSKKFALKKDHDSAFKKRKTKMLFSVLASSLPSTTTARGATRITGLRRSGVSRGREEGDDVGRRRRQQQQEQQTMMMSLRRSLILMRRPNKSLRCSHHHHQRCCCCSSLCWCCCCVKGDGGKTTSSDEKKRPTKGRRRPFSFSSPHLTTKTTTKTSSRHLFDVSTKAVAYPNEREDKQQHEHEHHHQLIKKGDRIPTSSLQYFDHEGNLQSIETSQLCSKGKTIVVFAVPGAFLPTCTNKHLPGFIDLAAKMKSAGCDLIACVSVNDAFVMDAWGKAVGAAPVLMCGDGSGDFTRKLGCELDLMDKGLGVRSRRYAMIVKDGIVEYIEMERGGAFTRSRAEDVLQVLEEIKS
jgi:peroxiredoxin